MGLVKGLSNINKYNDEQQARRDAANAPRVVWFKLSDGQTAHGRFLQELDDSAPGYTEKNNIGFQAVEHTSPIAAAQNKFGVRALCSADDEGRCVGCEEYRKDYKSEIGKKWRASTKLYINFLVEKIVDGKSGKTVDFKNGKDGDILEYPFVAVLSQGTSAKSITPALLERAFEAGTITDGVYKIKRNGGGFNDTSYLLSPPVKPDTEQYDSEQHEVYDLEKTVVRDVAYEEQAKFYLLVAGDDDAATSAATEASTEATTSSAMVW